MKALILGALGLVLFAGCGLSVVGSADSADVDGGPGGDARAPTIASFTVEKPSVTSGKTTKLTAVFAGGKAVVDQGVGAVTSGAAAVTGPITGSTTFTLTVTNAAGQSVTATTAVSVVEAPVITSFTAGAAKVSKTTATTLTAVFAGGTGAVDHGVGPVTTNVVASSGNVAKKTTFTLVVTNSLGDTVTKTADIDVKRELFVPNYDNASIVVIDEDADGSVVPKRTLVGATTTLLRPLHLFALNDELYVANYYGPSALVFDWNAVGDVAPKRAIKGVTNTTLVLPASVFVSGTDLYVTDQSATKVWSSSDTGDVAPKRTVSGGMIGAECALVDGGELYVANFGGGTVTVYPSNASGPTVPTRTFVVASPQGLLVNGNELFVMGGGAVTVFDKTTKAQLRKIAGLSTMLTYSEQCVIVGAELVCASYNDSKLYAFPVSGNGNIAPTRTITSSAFSGPVGLCVY